MSAKPTTYRTGLYGRTSKDDPRTVTIEAQQDTLADWWPRDPLVSAVAGEYWDAGISGTIPLAERPSGRRLLADIQLGLIDSVAVAYVDRWGRTLLDGLQAVKVLEDRGVKLVAVSDGWDARRNDSPLYFQFRMMLSEEEHRRIAERMRNGKARKVEKDGAPAGCPVTFGYRQDERGHWSEDPVEGPIVKRIFAMYLEGSTQLEILAWVMCQGVRPGRKYQRRTAGNQVVLARSHARAQWHQTKIGKILRNPAYTGVRSYGGKTYPCPQLVSPADYHRSQAQLEGRAKRRGPASPWEARKGLLTGLLECENCRQAGRPSFRYYHTTMGLPRKGAEPECKSYYRCCNAKREIGRSRGCKYLPQERLDAEVWALVESYLRDPAALVRKVLKQDGQLAHQVDDLDAAEERHSAELQAVEAEVKAVWDEQKARGWPMAWVAPRLDELNASRQAAARLLQDVRDRRAAALHGREETAEVTSALALLRTRLAEGLTEAEKRHILGLVIASAWVSTSGKRPVMDATVTLRLKWGEQIVTAAGPGELPSLPKAESLGSEGSMPFPVTLHFGPANLAI